MYTCDTTQNGSPQSSSTDAIHINTTAFWYWFAEFSSSGISNRIGLLQIIPRIRERTMPVGSCSQRRLIVPDKWLMIKINRRLKVKSLVIRCKRTVIGILQNYLATHGLWVFFDKLFWTILSKEKVLCLIANKDVNLLFLAPLLILVAV